MDAKNFDPSVTQIGAMTSDEARLYLESIRWPNGPVCPHCNAWNHATRLGGTAHRPGVWKCNVKECRKQFTVTVGTIFEKSKIPLRDWIMAFRLICGAKKGMSALQLQRHLNIGSYQTAWHMAHRIRHAMAHDPKRGLLTGRVEVDETYIGGEPRPEHGPLDRHRADHKAKARRKKVPVVALVQRDGKMRAHHVARVSAKTLREAIRQNVAEGAILNTDEHRGYVPIGKKWPGGHVTIQHATSYAKGENHINSAESFFALFKRGIHGAWHHVSKGHLQRYADEMVYRWNTREMTDGERTFVALQQGDGVRLTYDSATA